MKPAFVLIIFTILSHFACGQQSVSNVRTRALSQNRIEIRYSLDAIQTGDSVYFQVESRFGGRLAVKKEFVTGDFGLDLEPGPDKKIIWRAGENGFALNGEVRATVYIKPAGYKGAIFPQTTPSSVTLASTELSNSANKSYQTQADTSKSKEKTLAEADTTRPKTRKRWTPGPGWALVSAVLPGVGNMFVQTDKQHKPVFRVGLRPLVTVGFYGLLIYGLQHKPKAQNAYSLYKQQKNAAEGEPYYQQANQYHHRYYLATRAAAAIWLTDVTLTLIRGIRNHSFKKNNAGISFAPGIQAGQLVGVVSIRL
ncbi:hypothetical protein [Arsenicibacter rosenii]|uniref:DUF5683 domain-containing protein n=1 Tax=Arsenicibacter rosenii TaxID=1750698 RepID=A0A1S2VH02_9BACT|nr:hypothetical protein [Arsenicibacter rosenii]OIN58047.1 hypothetical protein BLX24_16080 [Arsenicibacter rosenii]